MREFSYGKKKQGTLITRPRRAKRVYLVQSFHTLSHRTFTRENEIIIGRLVYNALTCPPFPVLCHALYTLILGRPLFPALSPSTSHGGAKQGHLGQPITCHVSSVYGTDQETNQLTVSHPALHSSPSPLHTQRDGFLATPTIRQSKTRKTVNNQHLIQSSILSRSHRISVKPYL